VAIQPGMAGHAHDDWLELEIRTVDMRTVRLGWRMDVVTCGGKASLCAQ
jgi:hypothetical protein